MAPVVYACLLLQEAQMQEEAPAYGAVRRLSQRIPKYVRAQADWATQELQAGYDAANVRRTSRGQDHDAV